MKRVFRWLILGFAGLAGLAVLALALLYGGTEVMIRWPQARPATTLAAARDPGAVARGARIAKVYGCNDCHGGDLTGKLFFNEMPVARVAGPNLTLAAAHQSDQDLDRAIRHGVAADGRALWIMPSEAFAKLSDAETADLLAYLRSQRPKGRAQPAKQIGPIGRLGAVLGKFRSAPVLIRTTPDVGPPDLGPQFAQGRSLARACVECHGADLKGSEGVNSPDLVIAGAYDDADFERLLRTGIGAGNRKLGLMTEVAPGRFNAWSHEEIAALHAYLKARADAAT